MQQDLLESGNRRIYTVLELNREVRASLERRFARVWLEGEISNLSRPASGHLYFSLKDRDAQVRCAFFRGAQRGLDFDLEDGQHVIVFARVSLYEARGEYQLIVEQAEEMGSGLLRRQFEQLKARLHAEGLFNADLKVVPPARPAHLAVVTSPSGAALRDVLRVVRRRAPWLRVTVVPSRVQGAEAGAELAAAVAHADALGCDTVLLVRGGGSLEDLWAFNDERLARAIHACRTPLISGVGHEIDVTIADLAADLRAPTPSAAAELATPDAAELAQAVRALLARLQGAERNRRERRSAHLDGLLHRLRSRHPVQRLEQHAQRRDELEQRLVLAQQQRLARDGAAVRNANVRLQAQHPARRLPLLNAQLAQLRERLGNRAREALARDEARLGSALRALHAVSPLATLARGYAIVTAGDTAAPLTRAADVAPGARVEARLAEGALQCVVQSCTLPQPGTDAPAAPSEPGARDQD